MNRLSFKAGFLNLSFGLLAFPTIPLFSDDTLIDTTSSANAGSDAASEELHKAKDAMGPPASSESAAPAGKKHDAKKKGRRAEAFVAGSDWEFDGFVAGGQDESIKSMFAVNDLLYLNIGLADRIESGDRLGVYRRGARIRDPQTGKVIGFEVRKAAILEVTDRIEDSSCSARILSSYESVEIGDLVRRE